MRIREAGMLKGGKKVFGRERKLLLFVFRSYDIFSFIAWFAHAEPRIFLR